MKAIIQSMKNKKRNVSKKFSIIMSLLTLVSILFSAGDDVFAATRVDAKLSTMLTLENVEYSGVESTNLGGISVGAAHNRLFAIKSNGEEKEAVLFYYSNIFVNKVTKKIRFTNGLLGHANGMAIDEHYIYVTMWQSKGEEKNKILKISREAISKLANDSTVSKVGQKVGKLVICERITPKYTDNTSIGNKPITGITRYQYVKKDSDNYKNEVVKFIINWKNTDDDDNNDYMRYSVATLKNGTDFRVEKNSFLVENTSTYGNTRQDIFYRKEYGFFIPLSDSKYKTKNRILLVDISKLDISKKDMKFKPKTIIRVNESDQSYKKYEIESLSYIAKDEKNRDTFQLVFSCNAEDNNKNPMDRVVRITNTAEVLK